ncbi:MAG: hypothetical protein AAFR58_18260 [Cyanobacteria bacterium J06627_28]
MRSRSQTRSRAPRSSRARAGNHGAAQHHTSALTNYRLLLSWGFLGLVSLAMLRLLWPLLLLTGLLAGLAGSGWLLWKQQRRERAQSHRQDIRLTQQFYELLDHRQGRISALELAMKTRLNSKITSRYLHRQAQEFGAYFERTAHGDVIYIFNPAVIYAWSARASEYVSDYAFTHEPLPYAEPSPTEIAWAYAEQERRQTQKRQHERMAHANAKQLRALRQLSNGASNPMASSTVEPEIARGRAIAAAEDVVTIDVTAVNG